MLCGWITSVVWRDGSGQVRRFKAAQTGRALRPRALSERVAGAGPRVAAPRRAEAPLGTRLFSHVAHAAPGNPVVLTAVAPSSLSLRQETSSLVVLVGAGDLVGQRPEHDAALGARRDADALVRGHRDLVDRATVRALGGRVDAAVVVPKS